MKTNETRTAIITGASAGLGKALAERLASDGWNLVLTARGEARLADVAEKLGARHAAGSLREPEFRRKLVASAGGEIDLLVNNASVLGPTPLPHLAETDLDSWPELFDVNVRAPIGLAQLSLPSLRERGGAIVNITSDASTGPYPGWGSYGATKAALDQVTNVLAAEEPRVKVWAVDPGEMNTAMLAAAVGAEEAAGAAGPGQAAAAIVRIVETRPESGRLEAADFKESAEQ